MLAKLAKMSIHSQIGVEANERSFKRFVKCFHSWDTFHEQPPALSPKSLNIGTEGSTVDHSVTKCIAEWLLSDGYSVLEITIGWPNGSTIA